MRNRVFVYLITAGTAACKIGLAQNVSARLRALQTGSPVKLMVHATIEVTPVSRAEFLERYIHWTLKRYRLEGEWFAVPPDYALERIKDVIKTKPKPLAKLVCPYCSHSSSSPLTNEEIRDGDFRCSSCGRKVQGRRFLIKRVA